MPEISALFAREVNGPRIFSGEGWVKVSCAGKLTEAEATRVCLGTTFLIDLLRELPAAVEKAEELKEKRLDLSTTSINAFEAYIGAIRSASTKRIVALEALLGDLRIILIGKTEAEMSASIMVDLMKSGTPIEMRDALIAGCMLKNACRSIVTRNTRDFSRIPKIQVIPY